MWSRVPLLAAALAMAPLGASGADLVVWWEQGFYPEADEAVAEIVAAFEQDTDKQVELVQLPQDEVSGKAQSALEAGEPPDFVFGTWIETKLNQWAYEDRLAELEGALGSYLDLFDADAIESARLLNGSTGRRGLYAMPMGRGSMHLHVWNSLLERAGITLAEIPKDWEGFWSFWCDQAQPAVRNALGRDDIWGIGLPMSTALDTNDELIQFQLAYGAPWLGQGAGFRSTIPPCAVASSKRWRPTRRYGARAARHPTRQAGPTPATTRRS
jgi:multiple sugar transport system substrate-binding protein